MILLANGCSHTAGAELDIKNTDFCYEKAWPKHLAYLMNKHSINLARSGSSNDRILRTTIEWLSKYLTSGKKVEHLFVVIMWSGAHRTEIATDNKYDEAYFHNGWMPLVVGNDEMYKKNLTSVQYLYYKSWTTLNCIRYSYTNFLLNVISLQSFLKTHKIKYFFWNSSTSVRYYPEELTTFYNLIDVNRFPYVKNEDYNFSELANKHDYKLSDISANGEFKSHYDEESQIHWANYMYEQITSRKLL